MAPALYPRPPAGQLVSRRVRGVLVEGEDALVLADVLARRMDDVRRGLGYVPDPALWQRRERLLGDLRAEAAEWEATTTVESLKAAQAIADASSPHEHNEITRAEAAAVLGVTPGRISQLLAPGAALDGAGHKVGGTWLIDRAAVLAHREERRTAA